MGSAARWPNVYLVGAPRCGTGSLYSYLSAHPDIAVSRPKEPNYFATDLPDTRSVRDRDEYLALFAGAGEKKAVIDASIWQLYSTAAARNLATLPEAPKILVQLRNPLTMLPSVHAKHVAVGFEPVTDFATAYDAPRPRNPSDFRAALRYSEVARFGEQLDRYLELFDPDRIMVTIFDDFVANPDNTYRAILRFLEVDEISLETYEHHNASQPVGNPLLARSAGTIRRVSQDMKGGPVRKAMRKGAGLLDRLGGGTSGPTPLSDVLQSRIIADLADDVGRLSQQIGRELTWFQKATRAA